MTCGICGIIRFSGLKKKDLDYFTEVLLRSQSRGRDASGVANKRLGYVKASEEAEKLVKTNSFKDFIERSIGQKWVIGHTRSATQGNPQDNINNHPITTKKGKFLLVHNGIVGSIKIEENRDVTDSYLVAEAIKRKWIDGDLFNSVREAYKLFYGMATIAVISQNEIVLGRRLNPLAIGDYRGAIVFASQEDFIKEAKNVFSVDDNTIIGYDNEGHIKKGNLRFILRPYTPTIWDWDREEEEYDWKDLGREYVSIGKKGMEVKKIRKKHWEIKPIQGRGWFRESIRHRIARLKGFKRIKDNWLKTRYKK